MTSHNLMNIIFEAYKCKRSSASSRSMWWLNDIIPVIYIIDTYFYSDGKPRIPAFKLYALLVKICPAIPKLWQVQHEINIETGITFLPNLCRLCNIKLYGFLCAAYQHKEEALGFPTMYNSNKSNEK